MRYQTELVPTGGCHDCGGRCPYKVWVQGGKASRIEPFQDLRPCVRGYAYRQRVYSAERLKVPLKRLGERGEGKFVPISWDEALDTIADELLRVKRAYGPSAIFCQGSSASPGRLQNPAPVFRLINMFGGCIYRWSSVSGEGAYFASRATYGVVTAGHTREDILSSRLVLMWGWNPAETIWGTDTTFHLIQAKEKGVKFIAIDPRFTNSAALLADQWVPIRPGTDTA
ncbi:MAG: molybdopterin-dependent oxidoreductase, partial [Dehalococcoidia bacterium]|nr:molybdopterin-dependent oxidoreductase [Dehalococcoidia bacterium]